MGKQVLAAALLLGGMIVTTVLYADDEFGGELGSNEISTTTAIGFYFGGKVGLSRLNYEAASDYNLAATTTENDKLAGNFLVGYSFSQFWAAELGYTYYGRPKFKNRDGNTQEILQHGCDLMAKVSLPLDYGLGLYLKGGLSWVYRSTLNSNNGTFADKPSNSKLTPSGALGVNYWFAPNMALDLSWTKTMKMRNLPSSDIFALGLLYKITI